MRRLLESVRSDKVGVVLVLRSLDEDDHRLALSFEGMIAVVQVERAALSDARNLALNWIAQNKPGDNPIVAFPDADCTYPPDFLEQVTARLRDTGEDFLLGCYGPGLSQVDRSRFAPDEKEVDHQVVLRQASSVTIFIRLNALRRIGLFNPQLGVGTTISAGEDLDYLLRMVRSGLSGTYYPDLCVHHPYKPRPPGARMEGWLTVLSGHALVNRHVRWMALKSYLGLAARTAYGRIPLPTALRILWLSLRPWRWLEIARSTRRAGDLPAGAGGAGS